jgi:hypothetical protein
MAKILYSALVTDMRKKLGGGVHTKVRSGSMVRKKTSPTQPRTNTQRNVRATLSALAKRWASTLINDQRLAWNALATLYPRKDKFGAAHPLSGFQLYLSLNRNLSTIGVAPVDDAPPSLAATSPGACTVTYTGPTPGPEALSVATANAPAATENCVIMATAPLSVGRTNVGSRYRYVQNFGEGEAGPYDILSKYKGVFGTIPTGRKISVLAFNIDQPTGAKGIPGSGSGTT